MKLFFKKLHPDAKPPQRGSDGAGGLDLCSIGTVTLNAGQRCTLPTGISMALPQGTVGLIWPRSKLAAKHGIDVLAGVVDSDYRGEVMVSVINLGHDPFEFRTGDKIAQLIIQPTLAHLIDHAMYVCELPETERGDAGINSTELRLR